MLFCRLSGGAIVHDGDLYAGAAVGSAAARLAPLEGDLDAVASF
jgi:hypothetical protein